MNWLKNKYYAMQIVIGGWRMGDQDMIRIGIEVLFNAPVNQ